MAGRVYIEAASAVPTSRRRRLAGAVGAAAFVASMAAGCSGVGDLTVDGATVVNVKTFLGQVDTAFREQVAAMAEVAVSPDARCYYVVESGRLASVVCGPARVFSAADGQVWWPVTYDTARTGDEVQLTDAKVGDQPIARPAGDLVRPDGADPPGDADRLAAPQPPPGSAGLVKAGVSAVGYVAAKRPKDGRLIGPTYAWTVTEAGQAAYVTLQEGFGEQKTVGPAAGEALYAVRLSKAEAASPPDADVYDSGHATRRRDTTYTLVLGQARKDVTDKLRYGGDTTLVVAAPAGVEPLLEVAVDGQSQQVSLATGERTSTGFAAFYRSTRVFAVNQQYSQKATVGDFRFTTSATVGEATLTPYSAKLGWAPSGRAWLTVGLRDIEVDDDGDAYARSDRGLLPDRSYALATGSTKHPLRLAAGSGSTSMLVFEVPADLTDAQLMLHTAYSFAAVNADDEPAKGTVEFPAASYPVRFPA